MEQYRYIQSVIAAAVILLSCLSQAEWIEVELTNTVTLAGKQIDTNAIITTLFEKKDHSTTLENNKAIVVGSDGAGQISYTPTNDFIAVADGYSFCVGLTAKGTVKCWGYNAHGQCDVPDELPITIAITAGHSHVIALDINSNVWVWGNNTEGECNVPDITSDIISIEASDTYSFAISTNGNIFVWGRNSVPTIYKRVVQIEP